MADAAGAAPGAGQAGPAEVLGADGRAGGRAAASRAGDDQTADLQASGDRTVNARSGDDPAADGRAADDRVSDAESSDDRAAGLRAGEARLPPGADGGLPEPPESGVQHPWDDPPAAGAATEVAPGVLWMRLPLPMRLDHVNVYALRDADGWTLVDTGFDTPASREAWAALLAGPLAGAPVVRVLATHQHPDHIGLAGWLMEAGAELWTSRTAWLAARMLQLDRQDAATPAQIGFWRRAGMDPERLAARAAQRPWNTADVVHPLPLGFRRLVEGQVVVLGERRWRVAMGEGHAAEHVTLWSQDDALVIGGDQLLPGISPNLGVYPTEPEANPVQAWLDSCDRLAALADPRQLVLPGHKLPFTGLPARLAQLSENHESALRRLQAAMAEAPMTAVDAFPLLYRRRIGEGEYGLALAEAVAHVNALATRGAIRPAGETPTGGRLWRA